MLRTSPVPGHWVGSLKKYRWHLTCGNIDSRGISVRSIVHRDFAQTRFIARKQTQVNWVLYRLSRYEPSHLYINITHAPVLQGQLPANLGLPCPERFPFGRTSA